MDNEFVYEKRLNKNHKSRTQTLISLDGNWEDVASQKSKTISKKKKSC